MTPFIIGTSHAADPIQLKVGGFMEQWVGFAANDGDENRRDFDQQSDSEVYFRGSTKLDNGVTIAVRMDFEADRGNSGLDDSFVSISSDTLGRIELGSTWHADAKLSHGAPDVGISYYGTGGDVDNWVVRPSSNSGTDTVRGVNDSNKIGYYSPTFGDFSFGASYSPDETTDGGNAMAVRGGDEQNAYSLAVAYEGTVGDLKLGADAFYYNGAGRTLARPLTGIGGGLSVGLGAFTLGGMYTRVIDSSQWDSLFSIDSKSFSVGASYETGPYAFSAGWAHTKAEGLYAVNEDDKSDTFIVSSSYQLGAGVKILGSAFYANYDDEAGASAGENSGYGLVAGVRADF